jgi:hypothetical protein
MLFFNKIAKQLNLEAVNMLLEPYCQTGFALTAVHGLKISIVNWICAVDFKSPDELDRLMIYFHSI